jgi:hypothetical protein
VFDRAHRRVRKTGAGWNESQARALDAHLRRLRSSIRASSDAVQDVALRVVAECDPADSDGWKKKARRWLESRVKTEARTADRRSKKQRELAAECELYRSISPVPASRRDNTERRKRGWFLTERGWEPDKNMRRRLFEVPAAKFINVDDLLFYFISDVRHFASAVEQPSTAKRRYQITVEHAEAILRAWQAIHGYSPGDHPWALLGHTLEWSLTVLHAQAPVRGAVTPSALRKKYIAMASSMWTEVPDFVSDEDLWTLIRSTEIGRGGGRRKQKSVNRGVNEMLNHWRGRFDLGPIDPALHRWPGPLSPRLDPSVWAAIENSRPPKV